MKKLLLIPFLFLLPFGIVFGDSYFSLHYINVLGSFGYSPSNDEVNICVYDNGTTTGHQGTHHITVTDSDTFTFTVSSSRTPTGSFTVGSAAYTTFAPQGVVVEWDATNKILFYIQNSYDNQGTDAT